MRLVSWNVNGLRACLGKGFLDFCAEADADMIRTWKMADSDDEDEEEENIITRYGKGNRTASKHEPGKTYGHEHVVHDMIEAVRDDRNPQIVPAEAVKSVRIVCAIYESARTGKTVHL